MRTTLLAGMLMLSLAAAGAQAQTALTDCTQRADLPKAVAACDALVKEAGKDAAKLAPAYTNLATAQKASGDLRKALTNYGWALVYDRQNAKLWYERGLIRQALGQNIRAAADHSLALRYDPKMIGAYIERGDLYRKLGALPRAVTDATEALKLDPKSATALANRSYALLRMNQLDKAKADADEALKLDPKSATAYLTRGLSQEKSDKAKALADVRRRWSSMPRTWLRPRR